jgi:ribonuclease HI
MNGENTMKHVDIYTDGACRGNPGRGGWGAVLVYHGVERELSRGDPMTTNNRMELMAVIRGLEALKEPCRVTVVSDSKYVVDAIEKGWLASWQAKGWRKADKKPVLNVELWQRLLPELQRHQVRLPGSADTRVIPITSVVMRSRSASPRSFEYGKGTGRAFRRCGQHGSCAAPEGKGIRGTRCLP